jgi:calcineurin-like phosphoesterase family protein
MFFTSDTHFWHRNVITNCNRPFSSIEEMNETLIANWNQTVAPTDEIYLLGDVFFCGKGLAKEICARLNGKKYWIRGNHDWIKPHRAEEFGFVWVKGVYTLSTAVGELQLCHYPYRGDHTTDERYSDRRPQDLGGWLLHGHVHNAWKVRDRQINVGVDQWNFKPVHIDELVKIIRETP